jgi:sec-independent protein translocase protein TatA
MPFRVGPTELIIILVVVMIIFGVGRLPEIGGAMGKAIREFRSTVSGTKDDDSEDQEAVESGTKSGKKS